MRFTIANKTSQDRREYRDYLEAQVVGKLCQTCKERGKRCLPQVAYRNQEFVLWCNGCQDMPVLYKPESAQEFYIRTGTGDAIAQMQVERRRSKLQTGEVMLARIEEVDRMDEDQIIREIAGDKTPDYVYKFPMDGTEVKGLSWAGYKELAMRWGNIRVERPEVEDLGDSLRVLVEATDLVHNVTVWAGTHQSKKRKIKGRGDAADRHVDDDFVFEKAISKAQRNVMKNIIPHAVQEAAIESVLAGRAIPIGRTGEAPAPRIDQPRRGALAPAQEKPENVDDQGEIHDEATPAPDAAMFADKGQVMKYYKDNHGLATGKITAQYPDGVNFQDLTIQDVIEAAELARTERGA